MAAANIHGMDTNNIDPDGLALSHFGFHVRDLDGMAGFYRQALRFTQTDRGRLGGVELVFLSRDPDVHHQIALVSGLPAELPFNPINQISLVVADLPALRRVHARLQRAGATDMQPSTHGNAISLYCRDPEGNRLEIFMDLPWYCDQPLREPVDLAQDDAAVLAQAEAIARRAPRFMPRAAWREAMALRMRADQSRP